MGLYKAVARPLLFALPPETAHRVAHAVLGLPLPWEAIGAVSEDPRLRVRAAGLDLPNPVGLAAGFDKECAHLDALGRLGFGYVVGGTVTRRPRSGNRKPRIVRYPARGSLANSMGLPNPGAESVAGTLRSVPRTRPRLVSLADEAVDDVVAAHGLLEPLVDGFELNASCPNVSWGRDRDTEAHLASLLRALHARTSTPLFVKLPPFDTEVERAVVLALAAIAVDGGADGLTCSNSRPVAEGRLRMGCGGLSGAALAAATPRIVREVRRATAGSVPINACGGISSAADAIACLEAGAATVQVYTGLLYRGPRIVRAITEGLSEARAGAATGAREAVRSPSERSAG